MHKSIMAAFCAVFAVGCTTSKSIRTSIEIDATPQRVFDVLSDFSKYPLWNPYHVRVVGDPVAGAPLEVRVSRPDGRIVDVPHVHVIRAEPGEALYWGGGPEHIFNGEHRFDLAPLDGGTRTLVHHDEDFSGLFIGFADLPVPVLTEGYEQMNEALKAWVEADMDSDGRE
ncbi:SRPBCC family protein [Hyphomonas sp.]|uniref:SRPBCC family protein n=1 Tax=Hyphomonas sp. TaxID=87 RepID=UPI0035282CE7